MTEPYIIRAYERASEMFSDAAGADFTPSGQGDFIKDGDYAVAVVFNRLGLPITTTETALLLDFICQAIDGAPDYTSAVRGALVGMFVAGAIAAKREA